MYNGTQSEIGHVFWRQGRYLEAFEVYRHTVLVWRELGDQAAVAHQLEGLAFIVGARGQRDRAARLLGTAETLRGSISSCMTPIERREYDPFVAGLQETMGEAAWKAAWQQGRSLSMDAAIQFALAEGNSA